jgi:CheY-like chemotaxis protein
MGETNGEAHAPRAGARVPKILVVNDAPDFLALMREVLGTEGGYEVATLDQSEGVIEQATSQPPDLLIIDIIFRSGPSGLDVADLLAATAPTAHLPVLFCTALAQHNIPEQVGSMARSRGHRVLFKPFDLSELLTIVAEMLEQAAAGR